MAKILSIETATDACSVAFGINGEVIEHFELAAKSHTQRLLPMVEALLQEVGVPLKELDAIAFSCGPGSFTGLRIGIGVVQGLAFGANLPVIPVCTLTAMAEMAYFKQGENTVAESPVLVALDARMSEVYWGLFSRPENTVAPTVLLAAAVLSPELVAENALITKYKKTIVGIGSGWHYDAMQTITQRSTIDIYPRAQSIARLAECYYQQGKTQSVLEAQPVYVRDTVSWKKRQKIRTES